MQAPQPPPSASASLAATKAFLQDRQSNNVALSSAAAAAALRTHPSQPTQVADTITKRMVRKNSLSSQGSFNRGQQGPGLGLRRHSSSGSMTERSFRAPSPTKSRSPSIADDAPPVPAVPKNIPSTPVVHRRASSLEPRRGSSPAVRAGKGRGSSVDTGSKIAPGSASQRVGSLPQLAEQDADGRPRSVNFSRPISPPTPATSSPAKSGRAGHSGWYTAPVVDSTQTFRAGPPGRARQASDGSALRDEAQHTWHSIQDAANAPVATKRGKMGHGVEGARLNAGSMRVKPSGSAVARSSGPVDPKSPDAVYDPSTRTFIRKQEAMAKHRELHEEEEPMPTYTYTQPSPQRYEVYAEQPRRPPPPRRVEASPVRFQPIQERPPAPPRQPVLEPSPITFQVNDREQRKKVQPREYGTYDAPVEYADVQDVYTQEEEDRPHATKPSVTRIASEDLAGEDVRPALTETTPQNLRIETSPPPRVQSSSPRIGAYQTTRSASPRVSTPSDSGRGRGSIRTDRGSSLSPPRNAHFATLEVPNGVRHQPPPRSVSPAKSALKHSPSTSKERWTGGPASVSDSSEFAVDVETARKRRANRVSFDEHPVVRVAFDTPEMEMEAEKPSSPTQSRWKTSELEDDALDELMKPRAALPSFGSIRGRNRRHEEDDDTSEKVTETVTSSLSASVGSIGRPVRRVEGEGGVSSDHALAGIVAQDFATKQASHPSEPLPPEVTSVEGTGYYSPSNSDDSVNAPNEKMEDQYQPEPKSLSTSQDVKPIPLDVPVIALQPATPSLNQSAEEEESSYIDAGDSEQKTRPQPSVHIPGEWGETDSGSRSSGVTEAVPTDTLPTSTEPNAATAPQRPSNTGGISFGDTPVPQRTSPDDDSASDGDSIYSDAYEELTDAEETTFASIDQIVESPITKAPPRLLLTNLAQKSAEDVTTQGLVDDGTPRSATFEHSVHAPSPLRSEERRDVAASSSGERDQSYGYSEPEPAPVSRTVVAAPTTAAAPRTPRRDEPQPQPHPRKSAMKKTAIPVSEANQLKQAPPRQQASPAPATQMRKSMRSSGSSSATPQSMGMRDRQAERDTGMRRTMRDRSSVGNAAAGPASTASPMAMSASRAGPSQPRSALQKKITPGNPPSLANRAAAAAPIPVPASAPTYDSDSGASISSFQRERQRRRGSRGATNGRVSMRRSMRAGSDAPTMRPAPNMRPISPPERVLASQAAVGLRRSMRSPTPAVEQPVPPKSSRFSIRSLSPTGRLISPKKAEKANKAAGKGGFASRFDDSSDEDEARPRHFQSRFADSDSDDEGPEPLGGGYKLEPGLAPVRGIPRRPGEEDGDSTDLEDEDSDIEAPPAATATEGMTNGRGAGVLKSKHAPATELPSMHAGGKGKSKKRGFFGLGKKKKTADAAAMPYEPSSPTKTEHSVPMPPPHTQREADPDDATDTGSPAANRPLTPIGEDPALESSPQRSHQHQRSPKLQRRLTPQWSRGTSTKTDEAGSWPLPATPLERPGTAERRSSFKRHAGLGKDKEKGLIVGKTGKKKKFQGLRRVLGLHD